MSVTEGICSQCSEWSYECNCSEEVVHLQSQLDAIGREAVAMKNSYCGCTQAPCDCMDGLETQAIDKWEKENGK